MNKKQEIIRRPDFAGGGITEAERTAMAAHVELWKSRAFRTSPIEVEKIVPAIQGLYRSAKLKEPRIVIVSSPRIMAFAGGFAAAIWYARKNLNYAATYDATDAATDDATRAATVAATYDATRAATYDATDAATRAATVAATDAATVDATRAATRAATVAATDDATRAATRAATVAATDFFAIAVAIGGKELAPLMMRCAQSWWRMYQGGNMWAPWDAYLTAARDILGLKLSSHEAYSHWEQAAIHGGFRLMHDEFCMVSDFPEVLRVDEQNRPHCEDGPSHRWRDGWELYHWHGVSVPKEWITDKAITPKEALHWNNIEQRRAACEILGWDKILAELSCKVIDQDKDQSIGTLLEANIPDSGKERFLKVLCGTGRVFVLPVPPNVTTARSANAWTYSLPSESFAPEVRT